MSETGLIARAVERGWVRLASATKPQTPTPPKQLSRSWKMPRTWDRNTVKRSEAIRARDRRNWQRFVTRRHMAGLSIRGTPLKRRHADFTLLNAADAVSASLAKLFPLLPAETQREVMQLQKQLTALKRRVGASKSSIVNRKS